METVFDHNPTEEKLEYLFDDPHISKDEYMSYGDNQAQAYTFIYYLYKYRHNDEKTKEYMDKIPNTFRKWSCICYNDHPDFRACGQKQAERLKDVIKTDENNDF